MNNNHKKQTLYQGEWVDEIPCREFVEWVTDYLEDKLPVGQRLLFDAHVAQCLSLIHI